MAHAPAPAPCSRTHPRTLARDQTPKPLIATPRPRLRLGSVGNLGAEREAPRRAAPATAERPGESDVLFQHRVHAGHGGDGVVGVCGGGATAGPAVATRPAPPVPASSNPALVRIPAAPLEFKPQRPPSFPPLLPAEARRSRGAERREADQRSPKLGQGSGDVCHIK